jgi:hypothetical protein
MTNLPTDPMLFYNSCMCTDEQCIACNRIRSEIERLRSSEREGWTYAEQLEQSILAISVTSPMSADTRARLANLVRASIRTTDDVSGDTDV